MSNADSDGHDPHPSDENREPELSRGSSNDKRSPADIILVMFADEVSDWILQAGRWLLEQIISSL
ncbi:hypothetical protein OH797_23210 [Streptomyces anulatus]|uniref:hypothetical protein n=1 Tax=Streptomyces anulatus TaxID=1892 RepID=UPI00167AA2BD|nr:hypothetical protein [Streptomyces anulatus]GGY63150.1 hypothetical protein GCM10010342_58990 [Streptomyces anulatus]